MPLDSLDVNSHSLADLSRTIDLPEVHSDWVRELWTSVTAATLTNEKGEIAPPASEVEPRILC